MLKKVVGGTLLIGLIGVLVVGAVYRTMDRTDKVEQGRREDGVGRGRTAAEENVFVANGRGQGGGYAQDRSLELDKPGEGNGRGGGNSRGGGNNAAERQYPNYETAPAEWSTVEGIVVQVPDVGVELVIETTEGEQFVIGTGPLDLAAQDFALQTGEAIQVMGYWEEDEFKAAQLTQLETGQTLALRDEYGRPAWSGEGRNAQSIERGGTGEAEVNAWVEVQGNVVFVDTSSLVIETQDGQEIEITGRPWRFAQEIGFWANVGDGLTLTGFFEGDEFEVALIAGSNGQAAVLRDQNGRPMWAGGGRRGG